MGMNDAGGSAFDSGVIPQPAKCLQSLTLTCCVILCVTFRRGSSPVSMVVRSVNNMSNASTGLRN